MQLKFFSIPALDDDSGRLEELNAFLRSHRILNVRYELVNQKDTSYWCCGVEYIENAVSPSEQARKNVVREKTDYRKILSEEEFERFRILRECRKEVAGEEVIPPYAIFLDEHLAELAKHTKIEESTLKGIDGFGAKKFEKYGKRFLELWSLKKQNEAGGESVLENSGN